MFDYARNMQLALQDLARRSALKIGAGVVVLIGLGFLLAALWSFLATGLGWGAVNASLAIGGGFLAIGVVLLLAGGRVAHPAPTTEDLKREVEARLTLAADAAADRARSEVMRVVDGAADRANALLGRAGDQASRVVGETGDAIRDTARMAGLSPENIAAAKESAKDYTRKAGAAANTNAGSMAKLIGAFAIGVTLASQLRERRRSQVDDFDDDYYA
ncbi:phage holin family protein [Paracoccus sp. M683]|uniref:phage holin family protein n=1 Tax=Paracoccus sp. M683 TaxID=2594268 RepID=UPI00117FEAD2|nr:phage holin family protein [Paracoccus sp. M683]TRW96232.1 phage holin family protein [Paracoccus sp. M683]